MFDIKRFEAEVVSLEKNSLKKYDVLFYGNSYFAFWKDKISGEFADFFGNAKVASHGFGGATGAELLYYYDRLVAPYSPEIMFWTEGANDFGMGYGLDEAFGNAVSVFGLAKAANISLVLLSAIETPKIFSPKSALYCADSVDKARQYGKLIKKYAEENDCIFIDIQPFFYEKGCVGNPEKFRDVYRDDVTHLNDEGYAQFGEYIKNNLRKTDVLQRLKK